MSSWKMSSSSLGLPLLTDNLVKLQQLVNVPPEKPNNAEYSCQIYNHV